MTSPPVILVTPQELSQSLNPSLSSSAYWVNFTKVEMIPTIGKSQKSFTRSIPIFAVIAPRQAIPANTLSLD
jgi:hypothetical protein